jgi:hypothetical protein
MALVRGCHGGTRGRGVNFVGVGQTVHQDRARAGRGDGERGGDVAVGGGDMTSSPGPTPHALRAHRSASQPVATPIAIARAPQKDCEFVFELGDIIAQDKGRLGETHDPRRPTPRRADCGTEFEDQQKELAWLLIHILTCTGQV